MMLRKPTCADCPHNLQYMERLPIKKKGVTMHLGERFCVAGKRARKFKRSDPKTYVPSWCPRLKAPCELRIYGFKNQREWRMHRSMRAYLGEDTSPSAFRYAVRYEGHTDLAPYEFFECCNVKSDDEILGAAVQHYDVVEIDDGIKPAFFYKTEHGYLIKSSSQSPAVMERWVLKVQALEEKKRHYEGVLQRELDGLDDEFSVLKLLSQELQVRANGIRNLRFQQRAA